MREPHQGQLEPGMDVCDIAGDKVGTIAHVYRYAEPGVSATATATLTETAPQSHDEILEVKTGLLGLGSHLYIPLSAVQEVLHKDCVFLSSPKHEFERLGWREKPVYLDELRASER